MSVNCGVCELKCDIDSQCIRCVGGCGGVFHLTCVGTNSQESIKTRGARKDWNCDTCKVSSVGSGKSTSQGTAITKEFFIKTLEAFKAEVFTELRNYRAEVNEVKSAVEFVSEKLDTSNHLLEEVRKEYKELKQSCSKLEVENVELRKTVASLETRVRNMEQYSRRDNLEISGVPATQNEDVLKLLEDIARVMDVNLKKEAVIAAHRVPSYNRRSSPPIVVKFTTRLERDTWIEAFKAKRPLTADRINGSFPKSKVFISEHLSPETKVLMAKTKDMAKAKGYMYVWSKEGKIFVRKDNGQKCKRIDCCDDLNKL